MNRKHRGPRRGSNISRIAAQATSPELAVVIPVYKHSVLLEEAVRGMLGALVTASCWTHF